MTKQTVLPFKLEDTKDLITAHAGLALLRDDDGLREVLLLRRMPSSDATGD